MKSYHIYLLTLACIAAGQCLAQNKIVLKDGKKIENAHYKSTNGRSLEYEQQGSLHDIELQSVDWVEKDNSDHWKPIVNGGLEKDPVVITKTDPKGVEKTIWDVPPGEYKAPAKTATDNWGTTAEQNTYEQGFADAKKQFHTPGSTVLGFVSTPVLFITPYGTAAAIGVNTLNISMANPQAHTNNTNPQYLEGYRKGMRRKKINNTFAGAGIFAGTALVLTAIAISVLIHGGGL